MKQTVHRLVALVPALALVAGLAVTARAASSGDYRLAEICVIGGDISVCVPHDGT